MWVPPEDTNPTLLHHPTRKSVGYFGAVRLRDGKFVFRMQPDKFNGDTFGTFLQGLWRSSWQARRQVVVLADNASYHHWSTVRGETSMPRGSGSSTCPRTAPS